MSYSVERIKCPEVCTAILRLGLLQTGTHFSDDFVTAIARVIGVVKF